MSGVRKSLQSIFEPHHTQQETHGVQAVWLQDLRQSVPTQGWSSSTLRDTTSRPRKDHIRHVWSHKHMMVTWWTRLAQYLKKKLIMIMDMVNNGDWVTSLQRCCVMYITSFSKRETFAITHCVCDRTLNVEWKGNLTVPTTPDVYNRYIVHIKNCWKL